VSTARVEGAEVVNVTEDSFSGGGHYVDISRAVQRGLALATDGALIAMSGGSTRPGVLRTNPW